MNRTILTASLTVLLGATAAWAAEPATSPTPQTGTMGEMTTGTRAGQLSEADRNALELMHVVNQIEIRDSNLARDKAQDKQVQKFAAKMANDHAKLDERILKTAQEKGVTLPEIDLSKLASNESTTGEKEPTSGTEEGTEESRESATGMNAPVMQDPLVKDAIDSYRKLTTTSADQFDTTFIDGTVTGHQQVVQKLDAMSSQLTDKAVKKDLHAELKGVQGHLKEAQKIQQNLRSQRHTTGGTENPTP